MIVKLLLNPNSIPYHNPNPNTVISSLIICSSTRHPLFMAMLTFSTDQFQLLERTRPSTVACYHFAVFYFCICVLIIHVLIQPLLQYAINEYCYDNMFMM